MVKYWRKQHLYLLYTKVSEKQSRQLPGQTLIPLGTFSILLVQELVAHHLHLFLQVNIPSPSFFASIMKKVAHPSLCLSNIWNYVHCTGVCTVELNLSWIGCLTSQLTIFQSYTCDGTYMCRRTEEEVGPTVGLPRHRHFVGFFNVPVLAPTRDQPFYTVIPTHRPI